MEFSVTIGVWPLVHDNWGMTIGVWPLGVTIGVWSLRCDHWDVIFGWSGIMKEGTCIYIWLMFHDVFPIDKARPDSQEILGSLKANN